jgi:hypothetical protein
MFQTRPRGYTGSFPGKGFSPWPNEGCCSKCRQPAASCCCPRECRREPKELVVTGSDGRFNEPGVKDQTATTDDTYQFSPSDLEGEAAGKAFIGGSCCVSISVEVAPASPTAQCDVSVMARDSEGTILLWRKSEPAGAGYRVYEAVIMTKPGARLSAFAFNCTARVRWCEIFSC